MKKTIAWIVFVFVTVCGLYFSLPAAAQEAVSSKTPSIDAVILLDHSSSMSDPTKDVQNDPEGYRFDATEMFISMCDLNGSRVAVIPFAGIIFKADTEFIDISNRTTRVAKLQSLMDMNKENATLPNTDFGAALCAAVKLIQDRDDTSNKPMIILLTDGQLSLPENSKTSLDKYIYEWYAEEGRTPTFRKVSTESYTTLDAANQAALAVAKAKEMHIPIYTIALLEEIDDNAPDRGDTESKQEDFKKLLRGYAEQTNGFFTPINASNVYKLPDIFGRIFAEQINSTLLNGLIPQPLGENTNQYQVTIPILNKSVQEANIFIPSLDLTGIELYDANGKEVSGGSGDVYEFEGDSFLLYKIYQPMSTGSWLLKFKLPNGDEGLSKISFSLLYNYNIALKTSLGMNAVDSQPYQQQEYTFNKSDTIYLTTRFYDLDGNLSDDLDLYKDQSKETDSEAWWTIACTYTLLDGATEKELYSGTMQNEYNCFAGEIDLSSILPNPEDGYNSLSSGKYKLRIDAKGAGLDCSETISFTLNNSAPKIADGDETITRIYSVDDPAHIETKDVQTFTIDLSTEIVDPDNDQLTYTLLPDNGQVNHVVNLSLDPKSNILTIQTIKDETANMIKYGTDKYTVRVTDRDPHAVSRDFPIVIDVESIANQIIGGLLCKTSVEGWDKDNIAEKKTPLTFTMRLEADPASTNPNNLDGKIADFSGTVKITNDANQELLLDPIPMTHTDDGMLTATYTTPDYSGSFTAYCTYVYDTYNGKSITQPFKFKIINHPPTVNKAVEDQIPRLIAFNPLPDFFSFLEKPTDATALQINLQQLFVETDNEPLKYSAPAILNAHPDDNRSLLDYQQDGDLITIIAIGEGSVTFSISATDGDGEVATSVVTIILVDITRKWVNYGWIALASLLALITLIIIIHQIRKPYFPRNVEMVFMEGSAIFESDTKLLDHTKKKQKLSRYLDMVLAGRNGILMENVDLIRIKPMRRSTGSIKVKLAKPIGSFPVAIEGAQIGKKFIEWAPDRELLLSSTGGTGRIRIVLTRSNPENFQAYDNNSGDTNKMNNIF